MPGRLQTRTQQQQTVHDYLVANRIGNSVPSRSQAAQHVRALGFARRSDFPSLYREVLASTGCYARRAARGTSTGIDDVRRRTRGSFVANVAAVVGGALAGRNRYFGVEVEFIGDTTRLISELIQRGIAVERQSYNHRDQNIWKVVPDGSLSYGGAELVSPKLRGEAGFAELAKVCEALAAAGCRVDASCGLHVHHDGFDLNTVSAARLLRNYSRNRGHINGLLAASRHETEWARRWSENSIAFVEGSVTLLAAAQRVGRYYDINIAAYAAHGTVEFRQHQGSTNFTKIAAWVRFTQALVQAAVAGVEFQAASLDEVLATLAGDGLGDERITAAEQATLARRAATLAAASERARARRATRYGYAY